MTIKLRMQISRRELRQGPQPDWPAEHNKQPINLLNELDYKQRTSDFGLVRKQENSVTYSLRTSL